MGKTKVSLQIFQHALSILNKNRTLLVFPILITLFTLLMVLFFAAPVALQPTGHSLLQMDHWRAVGTSVLTSESMQSLQDPENYGTHKVMRFNSHSMMYLTLIYFIGMFLSTFCNVAFCSQIFKALTNEPVSVMAGVEFAKSRVKEILIWSLFAGLVGALIRNLEQKFGIVGRFVIGLIGLAWSMASVFAIPVIIREPVTADPLDILRKSAATIQRTWGESLVGFVGLQVGGIAFLFISMVILILGGILSVALTSPGLMIVTGLVWLIGLVLFAYLSSVASLIYQCSLYLYASTGSVPMPFDTSMMDAAWKQK